MHPSAGCCSFTGGDKDGINMSTVNICKRNIFLLKNFPSLCLSDASKTLMNAIDNKLFIDFIFRIVLHYLYLPFWYFVIKSLQRTFTI